MKEVKTNWKIRRVLMFIVTFFCMFVIWEIVDGKIDTTTAETSIIYSYWIIFSVLVIYVFGVITDDQISNIIDKKLKHKDKDDKE